MLRTMPSAAKRRMLPVALKGAGESLAAALDGVLGKLRNMLGMTAPEYRERYVSGLVSDAEAILSQISGLPDEDVIAAGSFIASFQVASRSEAMSVMRSAIDTAAQWARTSAW
jgi:hypothetical protein